MEGYKLMFKDSIVTVWSAPNYCYRYAYMFLLNASGKCLTEFKKRCGNVAAILELDEHLQKNYKIFEAAPQETRVSPQKSMAPGNHFLDDFTFLHSANDVSSDYFL